MYKILAEEAEILEKRIYPTRSYGKFNLRAGRPMPFGASLVTGGINFSVYSNSAQSCELVLFRKNEKDHFAVIPFPDEFKIGNVFTMIVFDLDYENIEYSYRMDGPCDERQGHCFNKEMLLLDPYATAISGRNEWGKKNHEDSEISFRSRIPVSDFDWRGDRKLSIPMSDLIIYEMHVRSFTAHSTSEVQFPGTFCAIREKIPYLKELGVNCIELMPIFEFDEFENMRISPLTGKFLYNYWGYSTVGFFAPKAGYAATGKYNGELDELKSLVKDLHSNGIEVILDVVYNHTAEGNEMGPYISFKGIDNKTYYMLSPDGKYYNFSGCGNTLNCNNPVVRNMILESLSYWVSEFHIDGFRFDLASILGRNQDGSPMSNPPLLETLAHAPVLGGCKLIAEAWDAGGLYQVGTFPSWGRWAEWNGKYRDDVRRFIKGDEGLVGVMMDRLNGSPDLYTWKGIGAGSSINFITCHDGFTLSDLFSYNYKHNFNNAERNMDGCNDNYSWNCGIEGETTDCEIISLRHKLIKNAISILLVSRGVPMILSGDEFGNTQFGNNNAYCQDNEISWLDWSYLEKNKDIFQYFKKMIAFRKKHPILRKNNMTCNYLKSGYPELSWHGTKAWFADSSYSSRTLGMLLVGEENPNIKGSEETFIYVGLNMHWEAHYFELPKIKEGFYWHCFANTGLDYPDDINEVGHEKYLIEQDKIEILERSVVILEGKKVNKGDNS
jgi:glycogen operon protein